MALTGWTLQQESNVFPVKYELRFYISEDGVLHSHRRGNLKSYKNLNQLHPDERIISIT
jgi:hypothetical protein